MADTTPFACNLDVSDYQDRLAWITELNTAFLRDYRRSGGRVELTYEPAAAARVREFVRREQQCCPFLEFTVSAGTDTVTLVIKAPPEAAEAADELFAPYTSRGPST